MVNLTRFTFKDAKILHDKILCMIRQKYCILYCILFVPLFDYEAFHEAVLNAFIHNKWLTLNSPQISIFTDRIEILSHGGLAIDQDEKEFYSGASLPVNDVLASIFLQLRISERSGRGYQKLLVDMEKTQFKLKRIELLSLFLLKKLV